MDLHRIARDLACAAPDVEFWSARVVSTESEHLRVRQDVALPPSLARDAGVFVMVADGSGMGYAATSDGSPQGLAQAFATARNWAAHSRGRLTVDPATLPRSSVQGRFESPLGKPWAAAPLDVKFDWLREACRRLQISDEIVDWEAHLGFERRESLYLSSTGAHVEQTLHYLFPGYEAVASRGTLTQIRTGGGMGTGRQGGLEQLEAFGFNEDVERTAEQALRLLDAPECPEGRMDLLLKPSQMILQIHESIGHPLELDRILGDERNYAGTSFVTPDLFGSYRYGSELLNVTFAPEVPHELASYGYDDEGTPATREYLIREGILLRPLGGALSQARARLPGVANARACDWNRPPIDRMANLNIEPGDASLDQLIARVERGVLMETNRSWSIDDSRNKFQFGCEIGWLIEGGKLGPMVRNPNYRGLSAHFWRNLIGVGDRSTFEVSGVPNCGKGEPNQSIYVGHASSACLFRDVEVFGGEA